MLAMSPRGRPSQQAGHVAQVGGAEASGKVTWVDPARLLESPGYKAPTTRF